MKLHSKTMLLALIMSVIAPISQAQKISDPVEYMNRFSESQQKINFEWLGYISALAHNKSAKKVAKERSELITSISAAKAKASRPVNYEGDSALRVASYNYFNIALIVLKEDYGKIMDMEEIAEQSYDNMEAYLKAQEVANQKEHDAYAIADREFRAFAVKHNITIKEDESKDAKNSEKINAVNKYYTKVYLAFFKCSSNESYMMKAIEKKDLNGIEQNKTALLKNSEETLPKLSEIGPFEDGDAGMINASKSLLQFYIKEAKDKMPIVNDYLVKSDNFMKMKAAMDKKSASSRTQEDVDKFNDAVKEMNALGEKYNKTINELNQQRSKLINDFNNAMQSFFAKHVPKHK